MSDLPIDPKTNNSSRGAWLSSSDCDPGHDCPRCRTDHNRQTDGPTQKGEAVVATISLGGHAGEIAISPDGRQVYVIAADSVKVISRLHHIVGTYPHRPAPEKHSCQRRWNARLRHRLRRFDIGHQYR